MKKLFSTLAVTVATMVGFSQSSTSLWDIVNTSYVNPQTTYVDSYTKLDGTYVNAYYKTTNNNTNHDNYNTLGNYNTYTGTTGSTPKDYTYDAVKYSSDKTVYTGSKGGQYYINSKGNKTYVPKK